MGRTFACLLAMLLTASAARPADAPPPELPAPLRAQDKGRVAAVESGDTLTLADGGTVRLAGVRAPARPLGRPKSRGWPLARQAREALRRLVLGAEVVLARDGPRIDRHGRTLAQVFRRDGAWVQAALLRRGLARVDGFPGASGVAAALLDAEAAARRAGRGLWAHPRYRVRTNREAHDAVGSFQLVRGRVRDVAVVRGRAYLNFGDDWREDFTITLAPKARRRFESAGLDVESYEGRVVRVRGWIESYNGPMIEVTHPEQIEVLR